LVTHSLAHEAAVAHGLLDHEEADLTVLGDTAYSAAELREHLHEQGHDLVIKPAPPTPAVPGGFTTDDFRIDTAAGQVTCPAGHTRPLGRPASDGSRQAQFKNLCAACPLKGRCTRSKTGRVVHVRAHYDQLEAARDHAAPAPSGRPSTAGGDPRSNARSPGWSPTATAACATTE
jgi:hypothetical protein